MSYCIRYGPDVPARMRKRGLPFGMIGAVIVVAVCALAIGFALPEQAQQLQEAFFPWTMPAAREAFSEFTAQLRQGEAFQDAMTDFCLEIFRGAENGQ